MTKKIIVGDAELDVLDAYAYIYDYGKGTEVFRATISKLNHTFTDVFSAFENPVDEIKLYEDGELINIFKNYTRDFRCNYKDGVYNVELERVSALELRVAELEAKVAAYEA